MINMKYCIKCGKELKETDNFCDNCGYKIKKQNIVKKEETKASYILVAILILLVVTISISHTKRYINHNKMKENIRNRIDDKNSEITYKDSFQCKSCSFSCDGSCFAKENVKGCNVYEFDIKDKDVEYNMYYINRNERISYVSNRDIKLDYKYIQDMFNSKYKDYETNINLESEFSERYLKFNNRFNVEVTKYGEVSSVLTESLYKDISSITNKVEYIDLTIDEDLKLHFEKDVIGLMFPSNIEYYIIKTYNKSYDKIIEEIINNRKTRDN